MALEIPVASKFKNPQVFYPPSLTQLGGQICGLLYYLALLNKNIGTLHTYQNQPPSLDGGWRMNNFTWRSKVNKGMVWKLTNINNAVDLNKIATAFFTTIDKCTVNLRVTSITYLIGQSLVNILSQIPAL